MADNSLTDATPQFSTAEYAGTPGADRCQSCTQGIAGRYFRINGALTCASCAEQTERLLPKDSHAAYVRGLVFGVGGSILGVILYSAFGIITGLMIGYISLAVGFIVGKAIIMGSKGLGGRRYQIAAALLTYVAVSMSAVPIGIAQYIKSQNATKAASSKQSQPPQARPSQSPASQPSPADNGSLAQQGRSSTEPKESPGAVLGYLVLLGLASPFLELQEPLQGLIGLVILFVGLRIAWKLTAGRPVEILGPFNSPAPASGQQGAG